MIKEKKQTTSKAKNTNIKKKSSVQDLIRKEKYIPQFKTLIDETKKIGKISHQVKIKFSIKIKN